MAEGAPLLREYGVYSSIEGSNPSLSAILVSGVPSTPNMLKGNAFFGFENPEFRQYTKRDPNANLSTNRRIAIDPQSQSFQGFARN